MRAVRQAVGRVGALGLHGADPPARASSPRTRCGRSSRCADAWRDTETERGFSMALSRLGDPADGECVLVECLDDRDGARCARCCRSCRGDATACRST